ncbi:MAG TPA: chitobiase/beta-hexosaminidase C-terminal domain-containing protein, partial [Chitinispirillaceae bacterium]|nr:chitobiase/beta-hexosaminidase C-terminal domain-containing protein [Chitinispirillaceae bacterium]
MMNRNNNDSVVQVSDSICLKSTKEFNIKAVDIAGNVNISKPYLYSLDTTSLIFSIDPSGGIYNHPVYISFKFSKDITIWYTFDPLASQRWFTLYKDPVLLPYGLSSIRYFAKSPSGFSTEFFNSRYIIDTIAPKLSKKITSGHTEDTIHFSSREKVEIRFTRDGTLPVRESPLYEKPLRIKKNGIQRIKARAWDIAGNSSEIIEWEYKYDLIPPELTIHPESGTYTAPFTIKISATEPSRVIYTLDGTEPGKSSLLYQAGGIPVTSDDSVKLRVAAIDSAGNRSVEYANAYYLDSKPPALRAKIAGSLDEGVFTVSLFSDEPAEIYYEIGGSEPCSGSPVYHQPLAMNTNQILKYFAKDKLGNKSKVYIMNELHKPMVEAVPGAGIYNRKTGITFRTNSAGTVFWRILPDTTFASVDNGEIFIDKEGTHTFEYFLQTNGGLRGSIYRQDYQIDWTPPSVEVKTRKGINDSAIIFLKSNERATFYYTIDGTNPLVSSTVNTAGNKFLQNNDRLVFKKDANMKLSIFAEDIAGNQSALSVLDIFSPHAIPDVPASKTTVYDKTISISFHTIDESSIFYTTDGFVPTQNSTLFTKPITLMASDTIYTLVVDASGFTGKIDTFIYKIDLPPTPLFFITGKDFFENDTVLFDASESFDKESQHSHLRFRWDFESD